jgi:hypothetical protein
MLDMPKIDIVKVESSVQRHRQADVKAVEAQVIASK